MTTFIVKADGKVSKALIAIFKALEVTFEVKKENNIEGDVRIEEQSAHSPYDPEFVRKVLDAKKENSTRVNPQNIWESIL